MTADEVDYLVVGAGAAGMAFTDALIDHADVSVALVDRRYGVGGHWLDAYPFVRLHQAASFYGVASTLLGSGSLQTSGPEAGLAERSTAPEILAYYARVLRERMTGSGKVTFHPHCEHLGGGEFVSRVSGRRHQLRVRRAVVDARYLSPVIPAIAPPPFEVGYGAKVVPVNDLVRLGGASSQYVVVGSGKTATDACIWLLANEVDPDAIRWVRPREPWMQNRARVQPDPAVFIDMAADVMLSATEASTPDDFFLRLEEREVMLRIDRSRTPTMAKAPTLAQWELDTLRTLEDVVRLGHLRRVDRGRLVLDEGDTTTTPDAVVVHCAGEGLRYPPLTPIWDGATITLQPVRVGYPCFAAALIGFVEATVADPAEKNRLCPPTPYSDTPADFARMQVLGTRASASFTSDPAIKAWADTVPLNPARIPPERVDDPALTGAVDRFRSHVGPGLESLETLSRMA
ncbi:NAD(P)-binding protein [Marmoricola sp. RAF53]|uniref:NAD(P)-binding protein n=1 Tax=Marmoricola sp. RAF53 TaxID=3233059 RepID=UPI003F994086